MMTPTMAGVLHNATGERGGGSLILQWTYQDWLGERCNL
jgi:hypothetical protein